MLWGPLLARLPCARREGNVNEDSASLERSSGHWVRGEGRKDRGRRKWTNKHPRRVKFTILELKPNAHIPLPPGMDPSCPLPVGRSLTSSSKEKGFTVCVIHSQPREAIQVAGKFRLEDLYFCLFSNPNHCTNPLKASRWLSHKHPCQWYLTLTKLIAPE